MTSKRPPDDSDTPYPKRQQVDSNLKLDGSSFDIFRFSGWKASEIPSALPPLPKPADSRLEEQAFKHISLNPVENYEELEWLGDAWIQAFSTQCIYKTFRGVMKAGRLSQLRERLVRNKTLGSFLQAYGLETRIKLPSEILEALDPKAKEKRRTKDPLTTVEKIHGDVFEAYVGALLESDPKNGESIVSDWLQKLWAREIEDEIRKLAQASHPAPTDQLQESSNQPPKVQLAQMLACRAVTIEYKDMPGKAKTDQMGHNLFRVGVFFSGWGVKDQLLAVGAALKKSEAGQKAAEEALKNRKIIKKYGEKKQAFLMAKDEAAAASAEA